MELGDKIKMLRLKNDLTQKDLAKLLDVSYQTIQKYEKGIIDNLPINRVGLLAMALNTSPAYLMGWTDDDSPEQITERQQLLNIVKELSDEQVHSMLVLLKNGK